MKTEWWRYLVSVCKIFQNNQLQKRIDNLALGVHSSNTKSQEAETAETLILKTVWSI